MVEAANIDSMYIGYIIEYRTHLGMVENNTGANNLTKHLTQAGVDQKTSEDGAVLEKNAGL